MKAFAFASLIIAGCGSAQAMNPIWGEESPESTTQAGYTRTTCTLDNEGSACVNQGQAGTCRIQFCATKTNPKGKCGVCVVS